MLGRVTLVLVLASALPLGANRPMWWTFLALAIILVFAVQLVVDARQGLDRVALRLLLPGSFFLLVVAWSLAQALWAVPGALSHPIWQFTASPSPVISADPIAGLHHSMRLAAYAMVCWIAMRHSTDPKRAESFLAWIAVFIALLSAFGIYAAVTSNNPLLGDLAARTVSASFVNRNNYATFAVIGLLANLALYQNARPIKPVDRHRQLRDFLERFFAISWIYLSGILICSAGILLSESRAGLASAILGVAVYYLADQKGGMRSKLISTLVVGVIFTFSFVALSSGVFARLFVLSGEEARFLIYPLVAEGIEDRPLLGHGLGAFHDAFRIYVTPDLAQAEIDLAHSSYLENAFELGLPAAIVFYGVLATIVLVLFRGTRRRKSNRRFARFALAVAIACGFHAWFDFSLQMPAIAALFAFVLGLGWAQAFPRSRSGYQTRPG